MRPVLAKTVVVAAALAVAAATAAAAAAATAEAAAVAVVDTVTVAATVAVVVDTVTAATVVDKDTELHRFERVSPPARQRFIRPDQDGRALFFSVTFLTLWSAYNPEAVETQNTEATITWRSVPVSGPLCRTDGREKDWVGKALRFSHSKPNVQLALLVSWLIEDLGLRSAKTIVLAGVLLVLPLGSCSVAAAEQGNVQFFEQKIRPILVQHCYQCHSAQAKKVRGGLLLDTRAGLLKGGDSGPALVPGKPDESLLLKALRHEELAMPPKEKLSDAILSDFQRWIASGAPDPREEKAVLAPRLSKTQEDFWAFRPPRSHAPPPVRDTSWARTRWDQHLLAALEARGLHPAADVSPATLLRRLTLDLTGLPPTPEELDAFVRDPRPDALTRVVDRLLASPAFGERWGRHWLDVARYADSSGKGDNLTYQEAWRYRDYVIASFNTDKPFDRFLREQLAGDLLPAATPAMRDEHLTATGFLVLGPKALADRDVLRRKMDVIDDQIDTIGRAFLGLSLGCARCHDHKFDPVPTTDYYALAGILASTRTLDGTKLNNPHVTGWMQRPLGPEGDRRLAARRDFEKKLDEVGCAMTKIRAELAGDTSSTVQGLSSNLSPMEAPRMAAARQRMETLAAEEKRLRAALPPAPPLVMAVSDEASPADLHVNVRGNPHTLGPLVPRGFLGLGSTSPRPRVPADRSGRLELASWLTEPRNPLVARVIVNRVWQHLFGEGLLATVDNFGLQGERPSHPELLDDLAVQLVQDGWSIKHLIRSLVLSRAYGMAVEENARAEKIGPENRLLWRARRRRLEAEVIRDSILAVAGRLDRTMGGSTVAGLGEQAVSNNNAQNDLDTEKRRCRSIYLPVIRNHLPAIFDVFDFADPDATTGRRDATTVASQALYLMNSPFVHENAQAVADRLLALPEADRLSTLYRRALSRLPSAREGERVRTFLREAQKEAGANSGDWERSAWESICQAVFGSTEFRFVE
jgi:hypothetical protein